MREQMLRSILSELNGTSADIEASAVISSDGLTMAALLPQDVDEDRVGAMAAAMLSLGERTSRELVRGDLEQVMVKGENGYILMSHAGKDAVLTIIARRDAKLGLIFLDAKRAAKNIGDIL